MSGRAIVLVGHGSRRSAGNRAVHALAERLRSATGWAVEVGFIELARPTAAEAIDAVVARGAREVACTPAVLLAAGHARNDVPLAVHRARARHPDVRIVATRPIGTDGRIVAALHELAASCCDPEAPVEADRLGVLLLGRGCSDPDANGQVWRIGRLLAETLGRRPPPGVIPTERLAGGPVPFEAAYVGVTTPDLDAGLLSLARRGVRRAIVLPFLLYPGVLVERVGARARAAAARHGRMTIRVAPPLGTHPAVERVILARAAEALEGGGWPACDACKVRVALPGFGAERGGVQGWRKARAHAELPTDAPPHGHAPLRRHVLVCVNRDCADRGSLETLDRIRRRLRQAGLARTVRTTRTLCMGRCGEGPAVAVYPDGTWYRGVTPDHADTLVERHLLGDVPVGELLDQVIG